MGRKRKYQTEEERIAAQRESKRRYQRKYRKSHPDYDVEWRLANKEHIAEYKAEYRSTLLGRAKILVGSYNQSDKKHNRGECTLTAEWIVEHIFNQPCHYCGETDWKELGCDRIDNSLPHTPDNVVPCCRHCNCKKHTTPYENFMKICL